MPTITTFGGAAVRSFGRGIEQASAVLPANTVLFYNITNSDIQSIPSITQYSTYFNGSGDYLSISSQAQLALGAGDFTFEMWVYNDVTSLPVQTSIFDQRNGTNGLAVLQPYFDLSSTDGYGWYTAATYGITSGASVVKLQQWQHIAVCRIAGYTRMYVDGVRVGSVFNDTTTYPAGGIRIGRSNDGATTRYFKGYISDLRVVVGTSLYTGSTIVTPKEPLSAVPNTRLLTCRYSTIMDGSTYAVAITSTGSPYQATIGPYNWWSTLNASSKYLIGTTSQALIGSTQDSPSGTVTVTGTMTTAGAHFGSTNFTSSPYATTGTYSNYRGSGGSHSHGMGTASLASCYANTIQTTAVTTSIAQNTIPPRCVVWRKLQPSSPNFSAVTFDGNGYMMGRSGAANTTFTSYSTSNTTYMASVGSNGNHSHVQANTYYYWGSGAYSSYVYNFAGNHTDHSLWFTTEIRLQSRYLRPWVSTQHESVEYGMIVMYKGDLTKLPAGWRLCDGTLGTPNMNDCAVAWDSTLSGHGDVYHASNYAILPSQQTVSTTESSWSHTHSGNYTTLRGSGSSHDTESVPHTHSCTITGVTGNYNPPYYKIAFIQYKGI